MLPYVFFTGTTGIVVSAVASGLGLFAIGAAITLMTGRGVLVLGLRQVVFGMAAAAITYGVGTPDRGEPAEAKTGDTTGSMNGASQIG